MRLGENQSAWRRLDNTAKIFPVIANENLSNVFRLSVTLKKIINPVLLQQALEDIMPLMDHFRVKLRRGVFWYYFEENKKTPQVQRESTYPCRYIDPHGNRKFLFRVTYYEKRINLEVFHALTDGLGASIFLKELTYRYLQLEKEEVRQLIARVPKKTENEDSYLKNYRPTQHQHYSSAAAFRLSGNYLSLGTGQVLHGYVNVQELKVVCKKYGVSITKYLAAVLIWSVWQEYCDGNQQNQPIVLNLPINLRSFFPSDTMANFFAVTMIGFLFKEPDMKFERLLHIIDRQMDKKVDKDRLEAYISYNVSNEKNWLIRVIPLLFKSIALNIVFRLKDRAYTMTLSNVGVVQVDPEYQNDIERFHLMIGVSRRQPVKCVVCSYGEEMVITFSSVFADSGLQKQFFKHLKKDGIAVRLEGNELSAVRKQDMYPRIKKVLVLRKGGEAKASRMVQQVGHTSGSAARGAADYLTGKRNLKAELQRRFHV
ncbi:MAG: hypothetical protein ACRDBO_01280 [Lachnospiraceae bacterium]